MCSTLPDRLAPRSEPGNVKLGQYDETLVVDWGLAKPSGRVKAESDSTEALIDPVTGCS